METAVLFDPALRAKRQSRARAIGFADFVHRRAAREIHERLSEINRSFKDVVLISEAPDAWRAEIAVPADVLAPGDVLGLAPGSYDLVIHGLALHAMNDPVGQLIQARRALRPDGLLIAALFADQTLVELRSALTRAEAEIRGGLAPRVLPMGDIRSLGALLGRAGLALPVADSDRFMVQYQSPIHLLHDLRAMGETNHLAAQERGFLRRDVLGAAMDIYAQTHGLPGGGIQATFDLVYLTGWAPAQSQPRPLKPGSAQIRLADALGVPGPERRK